MLRNVLHDAMVWIGVAIGLGFQLPARAADADPTKKDAHETAAEIDRRLEAHWQAKGITPAAAASEVTVFRRLMLDLAGRIPTRAECEAYLAEKAAPEERYRQAVQRILAGPEFALHQGAVLEEMLQGDSAGNPEFTDYLRRSLRERKGWDALFRELLVGPWKTDDLKPATRFLEVRAKDLDRLTTDATRVFFGVDVSCARCHDHPLVDDWKQDHYYGMASFFNRTSGGKGSIGEKFEGDVSFKSIDGTQKTAALMFLSGRVATEPPPEEAKKTKFSRREQLVAIALEDKAFLSRSLVNRLWQQYFGRGLVHPVDQIHSSNPPSVPGLLEYLADDFADSGYDLQRLIGAIVSTKAYRLSSRWDSAAPLPEEGDFAASRLRLLSPRQYAMSLLVATGRAEFGPADALQARAEKLAGSEGVGRVAQYLAAEEQARPLFSQIDPTEGGQSSADEALYLSNSAAIQTLVSAEEGTLAARLAEMSDDRSIAEAAIRHVYCRPPDEGEIERLAGWLDEQSQAPSFEKVRTCEQIVWILVTSAEFRFQH
ncbi:MAG TPA: DUF1549 domain-containing protein [Pirellulaceae bacterium]|nr:DUF1549 domain-containing protein [Pirellulaceae bacterium]